jgi:hypothetical protein
MRKEEPMTMEQKVTAFWRVQRAYNGTGDPMATGAALNWLRRILQNLGEHRKLYQQAYALQQQIIIGGKSDAA